MFAGGCRRRCRCQRKSFSELGRTFDATLNFATWDDDVALIGGLRDGALGHAATVHPLFGDFDNYGWVRGASRTFWEKKSHRALLPKGTTIRVDASRPDAAALSDFCQLVEQGRLSLPIALRKPLGQADEAFDHVRKGRPGRALLTP